MTGPPPGVLEELDGARIGSPATPPHAMSWPRAMAEASGAALTRPRLWAFALVAFLARGGLVVLVIPMLVLPTFIGLSNTVGPTSVTAAGPTPRLIALVATLAAVVLTALVGGTLAGAAAEVALHREMVAPGPAGGSSALTARWVTAPATTTRAAALRVAGLRLALLVPVGLALAVALPAWVQVAYDELLLPSDLGVPLPLRVVGGAPVATGIVVATWLVAEVFGGLAARRIALRDSTIRRAALATIGDAMRAPASILLTIVVSLVGTLLVLVPAAVVVGIGWDQARVALVDGTDGLRVIVTTFMLATAWAGCLLLAALAAAWRSALWTAEQARDTGGR